MKLTSVEFHPSGSTDYAVLSFRDPARQNKFNIKGFSGLDAEEITPRAEGSNKITSLAMPARNVVARISLNPRFALGESYSSLRDELYRFIASSRTGLVEIQFKDNGTVVAVLQGYIVKFESPQSNKEQEVQLTFRCDDPVLKSPNRIPFDVESFNPALTIIHDNISTAPHGFLFELQILVDTPSIKITDPNDSSWSFEVSPDSGFDVGDVYYFSSEVNNKYVYLVRSGNTIYLADKIEIGSSWPVVFPGENRFVLTNAANLNWQSLQHYATYWGV